MIKRKIRNADKQLLAQAAKELAKQYGAKTVKQSMSMFGGNTVIGHFTDDGQRILSWEIIDPSGNCVFQFSSEDNKKPAKNETVNDKKDSVSKPARKTSKLQSSFSTAAQNVPSKPAHSKTAPQVVAQSIQASTPVEPAQPKPKIPTDIQDVPGFVDYASMSANFEIAANDDEEAFEDFVDDNEIYDDYDVLTSDEASEFFDDDEVSSAYDDLEDLNEIYESYDDFEQYGNTNYINASAVDGEISQEVLDNMPSMRKEAKNKGKKHIGRNIAIILLVIILLFSAGIGAYFFLSSNGIIPELNSGVSLFEKEAQVPDEPDYSQYSQIPEEAMDRIRITTGETIYDVRQKLVDIGAIAAARDFVPIAEENELSSQLRSGNYIILGSETAEELVKRFAEGDLVPDGVIGVNEGDDIQDVANAIEAAHLPYGEQEFLKAARDVNLYRGEFPMLAALPENIPSIEGYIYSDEYNLNAAKTAEDAVRMMLRPTQKWYEQLSITPEEWHAILTKASMIQKEAMYDEDRPLIASVIDNRLLRGMNLQIDATVKYANGSDAARVMESDLLVESPYNTYAVSGLPIGPICSGIPIKDVEAVMHHENTNFLYYVLKDKEGHHEFCETPEAFEVAKQHYLELFGYTD